MPRVDLLSISCRVVIAGTLAVSGHALAAPALDKNMPDAENAKVAELFQDQARKIEAFTGGQMKMVLLHTDDPMVRQFVAQGIAKTTSEDFARKENGLAAVMVENGKINGVQTRACYIVYNKERAGHIWRNFLTSMAKGDDMSVGAAFLIGHEAAHCLDHSERLAMLGEKSSWETGKAAAFGILPDAWRLAGGGDSITLNDYKKNARSFYAQREQMQYTERVADIFGMLWAYSQGAAPETVDVLRKGRVAQDWSTHATAPALVGLEEHAPRMRGMGAAEMWALARGMQVQAGVHESVAMNGDKAGTVEIKAEPETRVAASLPGDGKPKPVQFGGGKQTGTPQNKGPVQFNSLPKFGQRGFSGH